MKPPSSRMPPEPEPDFTGRQKLIRVVLICVLAVALCAFAYDVYEQPFKLVEMLVKTGLTIALIGAIHRFHLFWVTRHRRRLAASRWGEDFGTFAGSFDRGTDISILRAVYEELSQNLAIEGRPFPVLRTDHWSTDLKISPDDLNDLIADMAGRAQRSLDGVKKNWLSRNVQTVGDIVTFLESRPSIATGYAVKPAKGSQPICPEINQTTSAAGCRS